MVLPLQKLLIILSLFWAPRASAQLLSTEQIHSLKLIIHNSIKNQKVTTPGTLFHGSYDWHSDVHAHWSLLSIARLENDSVLEDELTQILDLRRLEKEYRFLRNADQKNFELPYGRFWFLMLLRELSTRSIGKNERFQFIRSQLIRESLLWLQRSPFPEFPNRNHISADHDSWLMALLLFKFSTNDSNAFDLQIDDLIQNKVIPIEKRLKQRAPISWEFLSLPSLKHMILPRGEYQGKIFSVPKSGSRECHDPGLALSSIWAYSMECGNGNSSSCKTAEQAVQQIYQRKSIWAEDFACYSHWVPQFIWINHWLSLRDK